MLWLLCLLLLAVLLSLAILLSFVSPLTLLQRLRRMRIQPIEYRLRKLQALPTFLEPLFEDPIRSLKQEGFKHLGLLDVQPLTYQGSNSEAATSLNRDWEMLLFHPEQNTYAHIGLRYPMESRIWYQVAFYTFFDDRSLLLTLNGEAHNLIGSIPNTIVKDFYQPNLKLQWQEHCQALQEQIQTHPSTDRDATASSQKTVVKVPHLVYTDALNAHYRDYLQSLWDSEAILPEASQAGQPTLHRLQWKTICSTAWNILRKQAQVRQLTQNIIETQEKPIEVPLEVEVENFERMRRLETGNADTPDSSGAGDWLFWGSLGIFLLSFWTAFDSLGLVMFAGAIALHEGGHHWAMNHYGYRETSIVFLPFIGGAATGQKAEATLQEKIWVLLAGPMPGLLLGLGLLGMSSILATEPQWIFDNWRLGNWAFGNWAPASCLSTHLQEIRQFAAVLIGLNLFNLLPLYPLDGGQIAQLLLVSCHPWMEAGLRIAAITTLVIFGVWSAWSIPSLGLILAGIGGTIALLISLGLPNSIRLAGLQSRLVRNGEQNLSVQNLFAKLKTMGGDRWSFAERYGIAEKLWERCQDANTTQRSRCGLALVYFACLVLPLVGLCQGMIGTASFCQGLLAEQPHWENP